ncbi:GFA family protein [Rhizobium lentis]|uniref:GFA family protein n=1 Tax=Rhizobium lentis TaxID=1138194 RepID=UPI001C83CFD4|nr:GFA family protein [Rhizobium lentis]MBX5045325.1 GFA family protein [Rhizobium lentis]MBX5057337.1 GFA family protein [Rhizobium lentis]
MRLRTGSCLCGAVAYHVEGEPLRVGLCHCADCRKSTGSAFVFFALWPRGDFSYTGEIATFAGRSFCPACGSRLFCLQEEAVEIRLGSLDGPPTDLEPTSEIWIKRREAWLHPLPGAEQYAEDAD